MSELKADPIIAEPLEQQMKSYEVTERTFVSALFVWGIAVTVAGYYGLFSKAGLLWIPPIVLTGMIAPILVYYLNEPFRAYMSSIDFKHLTIFHLWRIPAAIVFFEYGSQHLLPERFVINAGCGDTIAGLLVPIVLLLVGKDNTKYLVFHIFSMLDFVIAVGTGLTLTILQVSLMETITTYPIVLIPLFGVPVTGALSIITLDRLIREQLVNHKIDSN